MRHVLMNPYPFVLALLVIMATILFAFLSRKYLERRIIKNALQHHIDATGFVFVSHLVTSIIYLIGFGWALLILPITQTFAHSLFAGAGISSLILGFASQQLFSNLINGVYPVIVKPFKIVYLVKIQDNIGHVREINLNSTIIEDNDQKKIIIPSSLILNNVIVILKETDMK